MLVRDYEPVIENGRSALRECLREATPDEQTAMLRRAGVPEGYLDARLSDFPGGDQYAIGVSRKNVRIVGGLGRGKTRLAVAILRAAWGNRAAPLWGGFLRTAIYLKRLRSTFRKASRESELDVLDAAVKPPLLVLDDFGAEKVGDFGTAEILTLIEERAAQDRLTIITSNLNLAEVHAIEPRLASRFQAWRTIELQGPDRRAQGA